MDEDFFDKGRVKITMNEYINECMDVYGKDKLKSDGPQEPISCLNIDDTSPIFDKQSSEIFHHIAARLPFVSKRARLYTEPTVSFLCTRVSKSTQQDLLQLGKLLYYLSNTMVMPRII